MAEPDDDRPLEELAASILDDLPVDWEGAGLSSSHRHQRLLEHLRVLSAVAAVHRSIGAAGAAPAGWPAVPAAPTRWGRLDVLETVGRGSSGDVFRAWDRQLDREVALKLLHAATPVSNDGTDGIEEGQLLARVRHPNVVTIYGADRHDGRVGLWMEFVPGRTLEQQLESQGPLGAHEALLVGVDLCRALSAVHLAGIVHRDVKAQNVMRASGGRLVLMDFGTGRAPGPDGSATSLSGTPLYLAPELFEGASASPQSDIYSLGVLLFHLVTGRYPVSGASIADVRHAHRESRRAWLRDLRPDLSDRFIGVVEPALATTPEARYRSAGQMEQALRRALAGDGFHDERSGAAAPEATAGSPSTDDPRRRSGTKWAVVGAAVVLAAAVALVAPRLANAPPPAPAPAAALNGDGNVMARRIALPPWTFVGRPSPDGRYLTYVDLNEDLCLFDLENGTSRQLTSKGASAEGAESTSTVSHDGRRVAYNWRTLDGGHELRVVGEDGRWPQVLIRRSDVVFANPLQWAADGTVLLTLLSRSDGVQELALVDSHSGSTRVLASLPAGEYHAALSLDGRFVALEVPQANAARKRDLAILSVTSPAQPTVVVAHDADDRSPLWAGDGRLLFISDRTGAAGLWALPVHDGLAAGDPELVSRDLGNMVRPLGLTRDDALYTLVQSGFVDVWAQAVDLHAGAARGPATPVAPTRVGANVSPEWSRDGRWLAYVEQRPAGSTLVISGRDGEARRLAPDLASFIAPRWSPDGRTILVRGRDSQQHEGLYAVEVATGRTSEALRFPPAAPGSAAFQWSPDARAIWFNRRGAIVAHDLESGRDTVVVDYAGDSVGGLQQWPGFRVSPDGRAVAYGGWIAPRGAESGADTVVKVQPLGGPSREVARALAPDRVEFQDWSPDGTALIVVRRAGEDGPRRLALLPLDGRPPRDLGVAAPALREVDVHPDGTRVTFTAGQGAFEVWQLRNVLSASVASGDRR